MSYGFRIKRSWERASKELITQFAELPTANISDSMQRIAGLGPQLRPVHHKDQLTRQAPAHLFGPALTVRIRPGDNLLIHKAIEMAEPGDIIVVDANGDNTNSLMGGLMLAHAEERGVGGFVLNGAVRDFDDFQVAKIPCFATGITHRGPYRTGPGEIGFSIAINGTVIEPGDILVGDSDGVVSIPKADADNVLQAAQKKFAAEDKQRRETRDHSVDKSWIDKVLQEMGVEFID